MRPAATDGGVAPDAASGATIHAVCMVLGEAGLLIRGAAGSGKSRLALELIERAGRSGRHASLVADDRVVITRSSGRLIARPHPVLAGLMEVRGLGIFRVAQRMEAAVLRLVLDLVDVRPRLPEPAIDACGILGVSLSRLALDRTLLSSPSAAALVEDRLIADREGVAGLTHPPILAWGDPPDV